MTEWVLTASNRCQIPRCGARAYVQAIIGTLEVDYCAHHYFEHADKLFDIGALIIDERAQLETVAKIDASA